MDLAPTPNEQQHRHYQGLMGNRQDTSDSDDPRLDYEPMPMRNAEPSLDRMENDYMEQADDDNNCESSDDDEDNGDNDDDGDNGDNDDNGENDDNDDYYVEDTGDIDESYCDGGD